MPRLLADAIVERNLDKVHEALIVHTIDGAREVVEILTAGDCVVRG